jgi:alpha-tubulin suppressor-like RCC1 family protein
MRHGWLCVALAACSLNVDYKGTLYACGADGTCPDSYVCLDDRCVPSEPEAATCALAVSAGDEHTCAIRKDGTAWCWGHNDSGQLGDGTATDQLVPSPVAMLTDLTAITAGTNHSCALNTKGTVSCWGSNSDGQLGDGTVGGGSRSPVQVTPLSNAAGIVTGDSHSCALLGDHTVSCWGANDAGQLGASGNGPHGTPLSLGLGDVRVIAAGGSTTCAIDGGGALWCWGLNDQGQLGDGTTMSRSTPMKVGISTAVTDVAVGRAFACAVTGGAVLCFGRNAEGQLGNTGDAASPTPVSVVLPENAVAVAIAAGHEFACATDASNRVWCWGENDNFQFADTTGAGHSIPSLSSYTNAMTVAGGGAHLCVMSRAHGITCSGFNGTGQLGDGHRTTQPAPHPSDGLTTGTALKVTALNGGEAHMCALRSDKTVMCWGQNTLGEVGDGSILTRTTPTLVDSVSNVVQLAASGDHTCALLEGGSVSCWGRNANGELGDGTNLTRGVGRAVSDLTMVTHLAAGGAHTCAVAGGAVTCWGSNSNGQLGDGTNVDRWTPVAVVMPPEVPPGGILGIAAGSAHTCAITANATVACWGQNGSGQLGYATPMGGAASVPAIVPGLADVDQIAARGQFTCAHIHGGGSVSCWGNGDLGQLGDDSFRGGIQLRSASMLSKTLDLAAGFNHMCARREDGTVWCWGASYFGQVGDGTFDGQGAPIQISLPSGADAIAAGDEFTCAALQDGTVSCWGDDRRGQLGDGIAEKRTPVAPLLPCP